MGRISGMQIGWSPNNSSASYLIFCRVEHNSYKMGNATLENAGYVYIYKNKKIYIYMCLELDLSEN